MLTKNKKQIQIPRVEWDKMKENPTFSEFIELLEDISDLEEAKKIKGKDLTLDNYLTKRELRNNN